MKEPKELPQVVQMELELLGMMLLKGGAIIPTVSTILKEDDFFIKEHGEIYSLILEMYLRRTLPSISSINEELRRVGKLNRRYMEIVLKLGEMAFSTVYAEPWALKIKEKSVLRKLIKVGDEIVHDAYSDKKPLEEILDSAEKKIFDVAAKNTVSELEPVMPILQRSFENIQLAVDNKGQPTGIASGFKSFDKCTNGLQRSDLILIAARPSMGKTAFALNIAIKAALSGNFVALFSLEMGKEQLGKRLLSMYSGIDSLKINTGNLNSDEILELGKSVDEIGKIPLSIDDTPAMTVLEVRSKARRMKNESNLDLILIDYLQLMQGRSSKGGEFNRQQEIAEISRHLKAIARELNVPIIALSQLSRNVEARADKRPLLSDLRESGSLEQDADIVIFLYREEYYNRETEDANIAEVIIAKNRNGPTNSIRMHFAKETMRFSDLEYHEE